MPGLNSLAAWDLTDRLDDLAFSPDGAFLAGLSTSGQALVVRTDELSSATTWTAHAAGGLRLAWHPAGTVLATGGLDGRVRSWSTRGSSLGDRDLGRAWVQALKWNPAGTLLAASCGKTLQVLDHRFEPAWAPVALPSTVEDLVWSEGGGVVAACQKGMFLCAPGREPESLVEGASPTRLAASPRYLAWCDAQGSVMLHEHATSKDLGFQGFAGKVSAISWSPGHRWIALGSLPCVTVWDCAGEGPSGRKPVRLWKHEDTVRACVFSPVDDLLATAGDDRGIHLWEPSASESCLASRQAATAVERLAWSPDGSRLASGDVHGILELLEVRRG